MVWVFITVVLVGAALILILQARDNAAVQKAARDAGAIDGVRCKHIEGLGIGQGADCLVWSFADRLQINDVKTKRAFNLSLSKLRAVEAKTEQEIREVHKSVVGRAIVGHLLVPGVGAIVGGMSGVGTKKKKGPEHHYLVINYVDDAGELKGITFSMDGNILRLRSFAAGAQKVFMASAAGQTTNL
jgi:hypothetical protein